MADLRRKSFWGWSQTFVINHSGSVVYHLDRSERGLTSVFSRVSFMLKQCKEFILNVFVENFDRSIDTESDSEFEEANCNSVRF
ncbi:hypothetical protein J6590_057650 [Homalodisca vitripennis]|nr:hypothetical protein J6590_057650 [Homalodisca vitripennis]